MIPEGVSLDYNHPMGIPLIVHLVSDATGTTLQGLARACLVQFGDVETEERSWNLIRTTEQVDMVLDGVADEPGIVLMTLVDPDLRRKMRRGCREMKIPCIPVLDPIMKGLTEYLGMEGSAIPGLQYQINDAYFERIDALDYAMHHDDGQHLDGLEDADVVLVGVSRTSKTPTSIYLANRGVKTGNIPLVPKVNIDPSYFEFKKPLYVGLTESVGRLLERRKTRLSSDSYEAIYRGNSYLCEDNITDELKSARKLFSSHGWPVIDVTKRSVEETATEIMMLLNRRKNQTTKVLL
jgi:hypothetical protein